MTSFSAQLQASTDRTAVSNFRAASLIALAVFVGAAILTLQFDPIITVSIAALLAGWSEADDNCGRSHISVITQLRSLDDSNHLWLRCIAAYTVGGMITSIPVGMALGLVPVTPTPLVMAIMFSLASLLLIREIGWLKFQLPQIHRQTHKMWADEFGFVTGARMWGAHIGIGFVTVIRHCGFYIIVFCAIMQGPLLASVIYASYWLGRTLPIWVAPIATAGIDLSRIPEYVEEGSYVYRMMAGAAIILVSVAMITITFGK